MNANPYVGTSERSFQQAVISLLEGQYQLLGSRRVLELLAKDMQQLAERFFSTTGTLGNGWMVFTGTRAEGSKAYVGQGGGEHTLVTMAWPVLLQKTWNNSASSRWAVLRAVSGSSGACSVCWSTATNNLAALSC